MEHPLTISLPRPFNPFRQRNQRRTRRLRPRQRFLSCLRPLPGSGLWQRIKTYFLGLPRLVQIGWISLLIGVFFSAKYEPAFLGVIVALVLGVISIFSKPRRYGLILTAAAFVVFGAIMFVALIGEVASFAGHSLNHKQQLVRALDIGFRVSLLNEDTKVLKIRNPNSESVDFYLRCTDRHGTSQNFFVTAPARDTAEFGVIELNGWMFETGETIEAIRDDAVIWREQVP